MSVLYVYFFIMAFVVGTFLNCMDKNFKCFLLGKSEEKKLHKHHQIGPLLIFLKCILSRYINILPQVLPVILKNLSAHCGNSVKYGIYFIA